MTDDEFDALPLFLEEDEEEAAAAKQKRRERSWKPPRKFELPVDFRTPEEVARREMNMALANKLVEREPKLGSRTYTRVWFLDLSRFDIDEETQYDPMRFTNSHIGEDHKLAESLNILFLKIMSSDVGYPVNVYGTVIVRDRLDMKCIHIFRRNRDNCQLVQKEGESLILTGPSRGIVFLGDAYFEINLKIKGDEESKDRQFSKGLVDVNGCRMPSKIHRTSLITWLSELDLICAHVKNALEGTIEIQILSGPQAFYGDISARTTDVPSPILLYDSNVDGAIAVGDDRVIRLLRRVVAVSKGEMLIINAHHCSSDAIAGGTHGICTFTPLMNGSNEDEVTCGPYKMQVKVVWSILSNPDSCIPE